jgi:uncharacterized RDD family membrane protein YckC
MEQEPAGGGAAPPPSNWEPPKKEPAPGIPGFVYGDVPNRVIAVIIDFFVVALIMAIVGLILGIVGFEAGFLGTTRFDWVAQIVYTIIGIVIGAGYFIWGWTSRATLGMRILGMQIGNAFDGKTLTTAQAINRYLALAAPSLAATFLGDLPAIGRLLGLVSFLWTLYLLYSTATSPTKQGFHDKYANTVIVKAARVA